jgi:hypothetical protein
MVRPEVRDGERAQASAAARTCCTDLAGESPVPVSAGAPGSRLRAVGEILPTQAERQQPLGREQPGRPQREVNAAAPSVLQPKGVWESRAAHVTAKATHIDLVPERSVGLPGVRAAACPDRSMRNWRGPTRQPTSGKDRAYKAGAESARSQEGVRGARSTWEAVQYNAVEGRGLTSVASGLGVSARACP